MNALSKILAACALVYIVHDASTRLVATDNDSASINLPNLQASSSSQLKKIDNQALLDKFVKFDVRWQAAIEQSEQQKKNQSNNPQQTSTIETVTLMGVFNEAKPKAIVSYYNAQGSWLKSTTLEKNSTLGSYQVSQIKQTQVVLTDQNNENVTLTLFKPTNYLTLTINTDE